MKPLTIFTILSEPPKWSLQCLLISLISLNAYASDHDYSPPTPPPTTTSLSLPTQTTYGLLALASNNQFDWGVPQKIQVGVTMAFTEGGNQAVSVGAASRVGGILLHGQFVTTVSAPDNQDDFAVIVGGTMRF